VLRKTFFILLFALNIKCSGQNTLNNDISISGIIPSNDQIQFPVNNANGRLIYYLFSINYCNFWKIYDRIELGPLLSITTGITKVEFNSDVRNGDRLSSLNYKALGIGLRSRCLLNKKMLIRNSFESGFSKTNSQSLFHYIFFSNKFSKHRLL
jgi:hypothetical protein